ncbi:hypothetical protein H6G36_25820 [Anabaena minutissima FACHB-250]|nr:hypothetical protein [Anabaena minutissima FACHB-250]
MQKLITNKSIYTHQSKIVLLVTLVTIIPLSSVLIVVYLTTDLNLSHLTMDQSAVANVPPYIGLFSNIGILLWCVCAAICLFSYAILKVNNQAQEYAKFFLYSGLLTTLLLVDDFFLLHEVVFPKYHISERIVYAIYMIVFSSFFMRFRKIFKKTEFLILLAAILSLGLSIICDTIWQGIPTFIEDTFKLVGITTWVTYFMRLCLREISSILNVSPLKEQASSLIR